MTLTSLQVIISVTFFAQSLVVQMVKNLLAVQETWG